MTREDELRIEQLIQLMRQENALAEMEVQTRGGWRYDHAEAVRDYSAEIDAIRKMAKEQHD